MTKSEIQFVQSLQLKKHRDAHHLFVAEGKKIVSDLQQRLKPKYVYTTEHNATAASANLISEAEMKKITSLTTPPSVLGIFEQPQHCTDIDFSAKWTLALDDVQDPGNVGTIIRLCDWFGIETLLCSLHTADCYAPKVVQATMGTIARIRVLYVDLAPFLAQAGVPVYGTFLEGDNIYLADLQHGGIVVLGSEGQGISKEVSAVAHAKLHIPSFSSDRSSESLNVASAAAVVCSEIGRRNMFDNLL